jgi:hypothetical protein
VTVDGDLQDWFEAAFVVRLVAAQDFRGLFRCKVCAALLEGPGRLKHRSWHLELNRCP